MTGFKNIEPSIVTGQIAEGLEPATVTYTTHDEKSRKAVVQTIHPSKNVLSQWHDITPQRDAAMFTLFTTSGIPVPTHNDLISHTQLLENNGGHAPLNIENGTIARMVDYAPGFECPDHRTHTVDLGVVIQGTVELILDSGEVQTIKPGGMIVQRGTMHRWRNPSADKWVRLFFVSISSAPRSAGGVELDLDLGVLANL